eukprot:12328800-Ditylum_brightwellii.AAC.1
MPSNKGIVCITATHARFYTHGGDMLSMSEFFPGEEQLDHNCPDSPAMSLCLLGACPFLNSFRARCGAEQIKDTGGGIISTTILVCIRHIAREKDASHCQHHLFLVNLIWYHDAKKYQDAGSTKYRAP